MSQQTSEPTVNVALGEVLADLRPSWDVIADRRGRVLEEGGWPDMLVLEAAGWPVVIEAKHEPHYGGAEQAATQRLGLKPVDSDHVIETAIALIYPPEFKALEGTELRKAIRTTDALEYALYTHVPDTEEGQVRLPEESWLRGSVNELAMLVHRAATPAPRVAALAGALEQGVDDAAELFHFPIGSERGVALAEVLGQNDDQNGQTRRMAMTVIANALVFHEALAEAGFKVQTAGKEHAVRSVDAFWDASTFRRVPLLAEWDAILERNYWPIFASAKEMLSPDVMPSDTAARVVYRLWERRTSLSKVV